MSTEQITVLVFISLYALFIFRQSPDPPSFVERLNRATYPKKKQRLPAPEKKAKPKSNDLADL